MSHPAQPLNTPEGALKVFTIYHQEMEKKGFDLSGKAVLNIGAGDLIGLDVLFLLFGAARVISLDLNPGNYRYPDLDGQTSFFDSLALLVRSECGLGPDRWEGILERKDGRTFYNRRRLHRITPCDAASIPLRDASIDFAFSNAVFEHIQDPGRAVREIARVLKPGGHTMHRVDLRDHKDFSKSLEFLKPGAPAGGCNLWRASRFEQAFSSPPLRLREFLVFDSCLVSEAEKASFAHPFLKMSCAELGKLRFMVYATTLE
jgi:SAM-dependent methyltransferase